MGRNSNEYQRLYNKEHNIAMSCDVCGGHFRKYLFKKHESSLLHQRAMEERRESERKTNKVILLFTCMRRRIQELEQQKGIVAP